MIGGLPVAAGAGRSTRPLPEHLLRTLILALLLLLVPALSGSGASPATAPTDRPLRAVATTAMLGDLVAAVGGPRVEVEVMMGPGVDPHLYQPSRADLLLLRQADLIFSNGYYLEGQLADILDRRARQREGIHAVAEEVIAERPDELRESDGGEDPHLWMDVGLWIAALDRIEAILVEYDPDHAAGYEERAAAYREELRALDAYVHEVIASIPENRRLLITAHDAFGYFGEAYGMEVRGIQGLSTDSEAGLRDLENLVRLLVDRRMPAVFVETTLSDKNVRALLEGARVRDHEVRIGGSLYSDAMGEPGTYTGTYPGMIDHNATVIARALGGSAPEGGWQEERAASEGKQP